MLILLLCVKLLIEAFRLKLTTSISSASHVLHVAIVLWKFQLFLPARVSVCCKQKTLLAVRLSQYLSFWTDKKLILYMLPSLLLGMSCCIVLGGDSSLLDSLK